MSTDGLTFSEQCRSERLPASASGMSTTTVFCFYMVYMVYQLFLTVPQDMLVDHGL